MNEHELLSRSFSYNGYYQLITNKDNVDIYYEGGKIEKPLICRVDDRWEIYAGNKVIIRIIENMALLEPGTMVIRKNII